MAPRTPTSNTCMSLRAALEPAGKEPETRRISRQFLTLSSARARLYSRPVTSMGGIGRDGSAVRRLQRRIP